MYIDKNFEIYLILSLLLTDRFLRGITERIRLKRILTSGEYITVFMLSIILPVAYPEFTVHMQN